MTRITVTLRGGMSVASIAPVRQTATRKAMDEVLERIEWLPDREFRQFEYGLVAYYRRNESEQERIAVALRRAFTRPLCLRSHRRIDEILAMLEHVHDPMIG